MTVIGEAFVAIKPQAQNFAKDTEKQIGGLGSVAKKAALALGGIFIADKLIRGLKDASAAYQEVARLGRITNAAIKSTGAAAGVSAEEIGKLAEQQAVLTGIDRASIQSGENVLLRFTKIRNELGKGNDIFRQATISAENLSVALGTSMSGAAIKLGKLLQDPVKNLNALSRAGVQFTAQQKEQIKALVSSGNLLGAQKVVLAQLAKQFGGTAAAAASPLARLHEIIKQAKEQIGGALAPVITKVVDSLAPIVPKIAATLTDAVGALAQGLLPLIGPVVDVLRAIVDAVGPVLGALGKSFGAVLAELSKALVPLIKLVAPIAKLFGDLARAFGGVLIIAIRGIVTAITPLVKAVLPALLLIVKAVTPIINAFAGTIGEVLTQVFVALKPVVLVIAQAFTALAPVIAEVVNAFADFFATISVSVIQAFATVLTSLLRAFTPLIPVIVAVVNVLSGVFLKVFQTLTPIILKVALIIEQVLGSTLKALAPLLPVLAAAFLQVAQAIGGALLDVLKALQPVLPQLLEAFKKIAVLLSGALVKALDAITPILPALADAFVKIVTAILPLVTGALLDAVVLSLTALAQVLNDIAPVLPVLIEGFIAFKVLSAVTIVIQGLAISFGVLQASMGGSLLVTVGSLLPAITGLGDAFLLLELAVGSTAAAVGIIVVAVAAVGLALFEAYKHVKVFHDAVDAVGRVLAGLFTHAVDLVRDALARLSEIFHGFSLADVALLIVAPFVEIPRLIIRAVTGVDVIPPILHFFARIPAAIVSFFQALPGRLAGLLNPADLVKILFGGLPQLVGKLFGVDLIDEMFAGLKALPSALAKLSVLGVDLIVAIVKGIVSALPTIGRALLKLPGLVLFATVKLPALMLAFGVSLIVSIVKGIVSRLGDVVAAFADLPSQIVSFFEGVPGALLTFAGTFLSAAVALAGSLLAGFVQALPRILLFFAELPLLIVAALAGLTARLVVLGVELIASLVSGLAGAVGQITQFFVGLNTRLGEFAIRMIAALVHGLVVAVPAVISFFAELPAKLVTAMADFAHLFADVGIRLLTGLWNGIKQVASNVVTWFRDLPGNFVRALGTVATLLLSTGRSLLSGLWNGIKQVAVDVADWFARLPQTILDALGDVGSLLVDIGGQIIAGLIQGLKNSPGLLKDAVLQIATDIKDTFLSFFHIGSPSQLMADQVGTPISQGIAAGITAAGPDVSDAVRSVVDGATGALPNAREAFDTWTQGIQTAAEGLKTARESTGATAQSIGAAFSAFVDASDPKRLVENVQAQTRTIQGFSSDIATIAHGGNVRAATEASKLGPGFAHALVLGGPAVQAAMNQTLLINDQTVASVKEAARIAAEPIGAGLIFGIDQGIKGAPTLDTPVSSKISGGLLLSKSNGDKAKLLGRDLIFGIAGGASDPKLRPVDEAVHSKIVAAQVQALIDAGQLFGDVGANIVYGIANGINDPVPQAAVHAAVTNTVVKAHSTAGTWLGIHSPSTKFAELGRQIVAGLAQGIGDMTETAISRMQHLIVQLAEKFKVVLPAPTIAPVETKAVLEAQRILSGAAGQQARNEAILAIRYAEGIAAQMQLRAREILGQSAGLVSISAALPKSVRPDQFTPPSTAAVGASVAAPVRVVNLRDELAFAFAAAQITKVENIDRSVNIGVLDVPVVVDPDKAGLAAVRELRAEQFRQGR